METTTVTLPPAKRKLFFRSEAARVIRAKAALCSSFIPQEIEKARDNGWESDEAGPPFIAPVILTPPDIQGGPPEISSTEAPVATSPDPATETLKKYVKTVDYKRFSAVVGRLHNGIFAENPVGFVQEFFAFGGGERALFAWIDGGEVQTGNIFQSLDGTPIWQQKVVVCGKEFAAQGSTKKLAKNSAALEALKWVCDVLDLKGACSSLNSAKSLPDLLQLPSKQLKNPLLGKISSQPVFSADGGTVFANRIAELVHGKYDQVMERYSVPEPYRRYAVLAGIVMESDGTFQCICVTTGTKCIDAQQQSLMGLTLKDMHAEILAIRCLRHFLASQTALYLTHSPSILTLPPSASLLTPSATFHLYISSAPCGDARVFSLSDHANGFDSHPQRQCRGQLRIKIEAGMGGVTVPEGHSGRQYWDAVMGGERMLVMSCSDKLMRRGVLGVQGGLGGLLVRPVYWGTVVVGCLWNGDHVGRALWGRLKADDETVRELKDSGFQFQPPVLLHSTYGEKRQITVKHNMSLVWLSSPTAKDHFEIIDCSKGQTIEKKPSFLCKRSLVEDYLSIWNSAEKVLPHLKDLRDNCPSENPSYATLKNLSKKYRRGKELFEKMVTNSGIRRWVHKCEEEESFEV